MAYLPRQIGIVSTGNVTTTPLSASATYTGTWEDITEYGSISIIASSDEAGTLYADFSIDGVATERAVPLNDGTNGSFGIHSLIPISQYFRVRIVNGGTDQGSVNLQVLYHEGARIAQPTSRLGQNLTTYSDVLNTRAVLANVNGTNVGVTDHKALQVTPPPEGKSSFGEALAAKLTHEMLGDFIYNVNTDVFVKRENQSGTITAADGQVSVQSGAAANSFAILTSKIKSRYQPGHGTRARFTSVFTAGVANSTQLSGIGDSSNGFFFGYNGTSFGVMHRNGGSKEVRTLTVSTASTTAENITITLDGDSTGDTVAVTNTGNTTLTANEIAAHDYSNVGEGWDAYAVGSTVVFVSWVSKVQTGSYSLSSATTAVGTFAQSVVGVAPTETWTAQASWNGNDIFDGNGQTGVTLDPTKGNVYQITYQWLGYGLITFYLEDPDDGEYHAVHRIAYANANTIPSLSNPTLPFFIQSINAANTSNITIKCASVGLFTDGDVEFIGPTRNISASKVLSGISTETPCLSVRVKTTHQSKVNEIKVKLMLVTASVEHTKAVQIVLYKNCTLTSASFSDINTDTSVLQKDTSSTEFTGGEELFNISLGKTGNQVVDFSGQRYTMLFNPGDVITAAIKPNSGNGAEGNISLQFVELF